MPTRQPLDLAKGCNRLRVEAAPAFDEGLLVTEVAGVGSGTAKKLLDPIKVDPVINQARPLSSNTEPPVCR
jgi:hypothetical protein